MNSIVDGADERSRGRTQAYTEPWNLSVLVVEDDAADRYLIARLLADGVEFDALITTASSLDEASARLSEQDFHVALVDYRLCDEMGDEVIAAVRRKRPSCATVLLSSQAMAEVSLFGIQAGANAALSKDGLSPELLETTIRFALFNHAQRQKV